MFPCCVIYFSIISQFVESNRKWKNRKLLDFRFCYFRCLVENQVMSWSLYCWVRNTNKIAFDVFFWTSKVYHFVVSWLLVVFVLFFAYIPDRNTDTFTHYQTNPELNQQTNKGKIFIKNCVVKVVTYLSDFVQGIERIKMGMKDCQTYKQTL